MYKTQKQVEGVLLSRNLKDCLNERSTTEDEISQDDSTGSEYLPTDEDTIKVESLVMCENLERRSFV